MSNPLLRAFVEKATEKSFDKGLLWGAVSGIFVARLFEKDKYKKLESKYYDVSRRLQQAKFKNSHVYAEAPQDGGGVQR